MVQPGTHRPAGILPGAPVLEPAAAVRGDVLFAGHIIFLIDRLGFWVGYVVFCLGWTVAALFSPGLWTQAEPWAR